MLLINNKECELTQEDISFCYFTNRKILGYGLEVALKFTINNKQGYIDLTFGYEVTDDVKLFINREYQGIPYYDNITIEVFDTINYYDTRIESNITIKTYDIKDNKLHLSFDVNDELINISYDGCPNITISSDVKEED